MSVVRRRFPPETRRFTAPLKLGGRLCATILSRSRLPMFHPRRDCGMEILTGMKSKETLHRPVPNEALVSKGWKNENPVDFPIPPRIGLQAAAQKSFSLRNKYPLLHDVPVACDEEDKRSARRIAMMPTTASSSARTSAFLVFSHAKRMTHLFHGSPL